MTLKSLIREAVESSAAPPPTPTQEDAELKEIIDTLRMSIKVIGCGGAGCNTINRISQDSLDGVEAYAVNTDAQHLLVSRAHHKLLIGKRVTRGLGAGSLPQVGEQAALENEADLRRVLDGTDLVFVTCGLGGGTGTGSAPIVARLAREMGVLTIAVCTLPFRVEGAIRMQNAEAGLARLRDAADTTIVIPNDKLLEIVPRLPLNAAFKVADEVLVRSIRGITEMITKPGLVNLDFADLKTIMHRGGVAMIGLGESDSENRAKDAVHEALNSPLLDVDISTATGALVDVVGGPDMTIAEAQACVEEIYGRVNHDARIIWGSSVQPGMERTIRCMIVITGVRSRQILGPSDTRKSQTKKEMGLDFVL